MPPRDEWDWTLSKEGKTHARRLTRAPPLATVFLKTRPQPDERLRSSRGWRNYLTAPPSGALKLPSTTTGDLRMAVQTWAQHKEASGMLWTQRSDTGPTPHHWIATFNASLKTHIGTNRLPHSPDTNCAPHPLNTKKPAACSGPNAPTLGPHHTTGSQHSMLHSKRTSGPTASHTPLTQAAPRTLSANERSKTSRAERA